jgi:hypothetical protein
MYVPCGVAGVALIGLRKRTSLAGPPKTSENQRILMDPYLGSEKE